MADVLYKIWKWAEHNRFTLILPVIGVVLWLAANGCMPTTPSPTTGESITAAQLQAEYDVMMIKFDAAAADLERQYEQQAQVVEIITKLASGSVADWPGLLQLVLASGLIGLGADNIRKGGVLAGRRSATT